MKHSLPEQASTIQIKNTQTKQKIAKSKNQKKVTNYFLKSKAVTEGPGMSVTKTTKSMSVGCTEGVVDDYLVEKMEVFDELQWKLITEHNLMNEFLSDGCKWCREGVPHTEHSDEVVDEWCLGRDSVGREAVEWEDAR